jgi:hypothetical protein
MVRQVRRSGRGVSADGRAPAGGGCETLTCVEKSESELRTIAMLLHDRNAIDAKIAAVIGRPMTSGHLGEWIAARIFDIALEESATATAIDGRFSSGQLRGRTANIKWYLQREGFLDVTQSDALDYYLVMTGPSAPATPSRGGVRPWCLDSVYLFDAHQLLDELRGRGVKIGVATSVRIAQWAAAEIYPQQRNDRLIVQSNQARLLQLLSCATAKPRRRSWRSRRHHHRVERPSTRLNRRTNPASHLTNP